MVSTVSVRELRNGISAMLRRVESGERLTVTVDRRPVAELVPLRNRNTLTYEQASSLASRHAADAGLLGDLRRAVADTTDDV